MTAGLAQPLSVGTLHLTQPLLWAVMQARTVAAAVAAAGALASLPVPVRRSRGGGGGQGVQVRAHSQWCGRAAMIGRSWAHHAGSWPAPQCRQVAVELDPLPRSASGRCVMHARPGHVGGGQVVVAAARHTAPTADMRARSRPPTQTGAAVQGAAVAGPAAAAPAAVPAGTAAEGLLGPLPAGSQQPGAVHHAPAQPPSPATGMDVDAGPVDDEVRHAAGACTSHASCCIPTGGPLAPACMQRKQTD